MADSSSFFQRLSRFRLRTLFVLMIVVAVPLAWKCKQVHDQRRVARAVTLAGGSVTYDYEYKNAGGPFAPSVAPPGPEWLRGIVGDDFFATIEDVQLHLVFPMDLSSPQLNQALSLVANAPSIRSLTLGGAGDANLTPLAQAHGLTDLTMSGDFTDEGIRGLLPLKLEKLNISSPKLTQQCLVDLKGMTTLRVLGFEGCVSREDALELKRALPQCRIILSVLLEGEAPRSTFGWTEVELPAP